MELYFVLDIANEKYITFSKKPINRLVRQRKSHVYLSTNK